MFDAQIKENLKFNKIRANVLILVIHRIVRSPRFPRNFPETSDLRDGPDGDMAS